jgi:hypothetical protein
MHRLLYVSESHIEQSHVQSTVANIVAHSQVKNKQLGVTGALLFTGKHFAQILEGSPEAIDMLMAYIYSDTRHGKIVVIDKSPITRRRFADWQMAYHGPSQFVSRHVAKLLHPSSRSEQRRAVEWITDLAHEFSVPLQLPKYLKVVSTHSSRSVV